VFFLPIDYAWAYKLYILAHVALAAFWAYRLARRFRASIAAAGLCALCYAFSGTVLLGYANVVYLVGAAWLPAAVLAADRMLSERRRGWAVAFGTVLALMTLGGDPQMAYNAGLLAVFEAGYLWWTARRSSGKSNPALPSGVAARSTFSLFALAVLVAFALAAVQVIPSIRFARTTGRAATETARSVYEIPAMLNRDDAGRRIADGLLCRSLPPDSHHRHVYEFSVGPWRLAEFLWPNCSGRQFPIHRRWFDVIPAEGRLWTPSLYMGVLPLVFALGAMRFRRGRATTRWLSWAAVLAMVASFGWYGLGWLAQEVRIACGADPGHWLVGAPVGGLYWLMTVLLPGYVYFRYPAKLMVVAALALGVLAARGWDEAWSARRERYRRVLLVLAGLSVLGVIVSLAIRPWWHGWLAGAAPDVLFGPLDTAGSASDLLGGFIQTAVVCAAGWWLLGTGAEARLRWAPAAMLALVAVDLGVANGWMVATAPADEWRKPSQYAEAIRQDRARRGEAGESRVWRAPTWMPAAWKTHGSVDRLAEEMGWERDTLFAKYNLRERIAVAEVYGTMMPQAYREFLQRSDRVTLMRSVGATYAILPAGDALPGGELIADDVDDAVLWYLPP
jgi:hypothetical protein